MQIDKEKGRACWAEIEGTDLVVFLPDSVWEYCRQVIQSLDRTDWEEYQIRDDEVLQSLRAVSFWDILQAEIVCLSDDGWTCHLCVWLDMPDVEKDDGIHGEFLENALIFDLGIEADIPEAWLDYSTAKAA